MAKIVLWIDDEYNKYVDLVSSLEKEGFTFEFAKSLVEARQKLEEIDRYDAVIVDIIMRAGEDYKVEDYKRTKHDYVYWGLVVLEELHHLKKSVPRIVVLTIVEDPVVLVDINAMMKKRGLISDVLSKGTLKQQDVYEAIHSAIS